MNFPIPISGKLLESMIKNTQTNPLLFTNLWRLDGFLLTAFQASLLLPLPVASPVKQKSTSSMGCCEAKTVNQVSAGVFMESQMGEMMWISMLIIGILYIELYDPPFFLSKMNKAMFQVWHDSHMVLLVQPKLENAGTSEPSTTCQHRCSYVLFRLNLKTCYKNWPPSAKP